MRGGYYTGGYNPRGRGGGFAGRGGFNPASGGRSDGFGAKVPPDGYVCRRC